MFRNFLSFNSPSTQLNVEWIKKLGGLIRVIIFDSDHNSNKAFVVVYHEQKNNYLATAFDVKTSEICWTTAVPNGGYGASVVTNDLFIFPSGFSNIIALSKKDGREAWQIKTNSRVRSPLNVDNNHIYFSSGGIIFELGPNGQELHQWQQEGAFFYGPVDILGDLVISLGTIEDEEGDSLIKVFAFHKKTGLVYSLPISKFPIISADAAGICWKNGIGFVGGNDLILSFRGCDGKVLWSAPVDGLAARHVCTVDEKRLIILFYQG